MLLDAELLKHLATGLLAATAFVSLALCLLCLLRPVELPHAKPRR